MLDVDDPDLLRRRDPAGMGDRIAELPDTVASAWKSARGFQLPASMSSATSVVLSGMGGSAIGGDLIRSLAEAQSPIPVTVQRGYDLPAFAQQKTLLIAVSHSGTTEETLSQVREARQRGCGLLALTSGGTLAAGVKQAGGTLFQFDYPSQPRAALGWLFVPLIAFFGQLGLLPDMSADVAEAVDVLRSTQRELALDVPTTDNHAKQLAVALQGRMPVLYGGGIMAEVAHRWKTQFNENSKAWAAYDVFPELNHNAVVGYENPRDFVDHCLVLLLESSHQHPRVSVRERVTEGLLRARGIRHQRIAPQGHGALAQMLAAILLGDYVSYYLAHLYGVDPTPVAAIDHLKQELATAAS
jgi:glucose/mannose-6-phosphate isomerase